MGAHMFVHPEGEVIAAAGAEKAGALYESSGASNRSLEDIAKASKGPKWFQLYFNADAGVTRSLLERAKAAGYSAIIITADALGPGTSDAFLSMSSPFPAGATFGNHDPRYGGKGDFFNQKVELTPVPLPESGPPFKPQLVISTCGIDAACGYPAFTFSVAGAQ